MTVQVKMFSSTGWDLVERQHEPAVVVNPADKGDSLTIVKVHEFDHKRMTMSVVVRHNSTGEVSVYCKVRLQGQQCCALHAQCGICSVFFRNPSMRLPKA